MKVFICMHITIEIRTKNIRHACECFRILNSHKQLESFEVLIWRGHDCTIILHGLSCSRVTTVYIVILINPEYWILQLN